MKYLVLILMVTTFMSCHNYKQDTVRLQTQVDSLEALTVKKDSSITIFLNDFTDIQVRLDSIKKMETVLDVSGSEKGIKSNQKEKILVDIATINGLLKDNKESIANLKRRLRNSGLKSGKLEALVNDLEKRSNSLEDNLKQRDTQIAQLNKKIGEQVKDIESLDGQIVEIEEKSELMKEQLQIQEATLNKGYYAVGTVHKLKDEGVVEKEGGILGIGSVPVMSNDFAQNEFSKVDIRNFHYLPLDSRKAKVISVHPADSYHLSGSADRDTLYVDNPGEFWSASKYLVVATR